jgi:hypothetical protein
LLTPGEKLVVSTTCIRRAHLELQGAAAFHLVSDALRTLGADPRIVALSDAAIGEELRHAEIYRLLGVAHGAPDVPLAPPEVLPVPAHAGVPAELVPVLHVVGMSAINETLACGFLELSLDGATDPAVRDGVREVLGDEIRHGRIGWAWLASAGVQARAQVAPYVLPLLRAQVAAWRAQIATVPGGVPSHGCPGGPAIEAAMVAAIGELVLPGFEHLGLDVAEARAWWRAGAP